MTCLCQMLRVYLLKSVGILSFNIILLNLLVVFLQYLLLYLVELETLWIGTLVSRWAYEAAFCYSKFALMVVEVRVDVLKEF